MTLLRHAGVQLIPSRLFYHSADRERDREHSPLLSCSFSRDISPSSKTTVTCSNHHRPRNRRPQEDLIPAFRVAVRSASPCRCTPTALSCLFPSPPPPPFPPLSLHPFLWYVPLALGLDRPLVLFSDSRSFCCSFCLCNFSVCNRFYLVLKSIVVCSNVDLGFREIFANFVAYVYHFILVLQANAMSLSSRVGGGVQGMWSAYFRLCLFCLMFI